MKEEHNGLKIVSNSKHNKTCGNRNIEYDGTKKNGVELWHCRYCGRYIKPDGIKI